MQTIISRPLVPVGIFPLMPPGAPADVLLEYIALGRFASSPYPGKRSYGKQLKSMRHPDCFKT